MFKCDWCRGGKSELVAAAALALALGAGITWDALHNQSVAQIEAQNRAADHADSARKDISASCIARELSAPECGNEAAERARPEQRNEYDLEAQRAMAAWTRAMGLAALIGMAVGIFGLGLIYRTWDATRENVRVAEDNLRAFKTAQGGRLIVRLSNWASYEECPAPTHALVKVQADQLSGECVVTAVRWGQFDNTTWPSEFPDELNGTAQLVLKVELKNARGTYLIGEVEYETIFEIRKAKFCYMISGVHIEGPNRSLNYSAQMGVKPARPDDWPDDA